MCIDCFDKQYYGFASQREFEKFEEVLNLKCKSKKIKILESKNEVESGLIDFRMYFKCDSCKIKFVMSIPDNAWRGYFLTEPNAIEYHEKIKTLDKKKKNGFIIMLILIIFFAIYSRLK
ncbi:hypothetical protein [Flavobacterium branchiophilum]|uniref:Uncharacterized protein n=1 Tax=Flavobacterium branchiophilum TaxID=55197 RepID=A0A2H3KIN7_9FLAO|nr:hypothetical protein [Flavobacterium branchiophilum]PDS21725.1 hypothetical protein B0A77_15205 [Flavobacterium branchiophilum]